MGKTQRNVLTLGAIAIVLVAVAAAFIWFSGGSGTPSATISAPTLDLSDRSTPTPEASATEEATSETTAAIEATAETTPAANTSATAEQAGSRPSIVGATTEATEATEAPQAATAAAPAGELIVFNIDPEQSEVRFLLDEDLRGERVTVVGTTNQVAGQIAVDFAAPGASEVGVIRINMRSIATDNEFRNRAIRGQILQSAQDAFEFAQFTPSELTGLPDSVTIGEAFSFQLTGDLQIRDITNTVTFDVTVTPVSETRLEGSASAVVTRESYGLTIPSVPGVANVEEEVELEIDFVAAAG